MSRARTAVIAAVALAMAGCGDEETTTRAAAPAAKAKGGAPAQLVGTYAMTLERRDLPADPAPELTHGSDSWTLQIANRGGVGDRPAITLANDELGPLESSRFSVSGDRLRIHDQACGVALAPVESEYRWRRRGRQLHLEVVQNGCEDEVSLTLLTASPWTRR